MSYHWIRHTEWVRANAFYAGGPSAISIHEIDLETLERYDAVFSSMLIRARLGLDVHDVRFASRVIGTLEQCWHWTNAELCRRGYFDD